MRPIVTGTDTPAPQVFGQSVPVCALAGGPCTSNVRAMNPFAPTPLQRPLHLTPGRALRLSPLAVSGRHDPRRWWPARAACAGRVTLQVLRGGAWLTWPGCEDDHFLQAGQSIELPAAPWGSELATVDGVLVEAEPRLSSAPAVVRLMALQAEPTTLNRAAGLSGAA